VPSGPDWYFRVKVERYGSFWKLTQRDILPSLSPPMQNFFIFALTHEKTPTWLRFLLGEVNRDLLDKIGNQIRYMWSTAPLLHLAGMTVLGDGEVVPIAEAGEHAVCAFEPISVRTNESGVADWQIEQFSKSRFIFEVKKEDCYESAMIKALEETLLCLQ
jgi:hypothetical protein